MSLFSGLMNSLIASRLKQFFTTDNLKQPSTWKGLVYAVSGALALNLAPDAQDAIVQAIVQIIGAAMATTGAINMLRNENKLPWQK